MKSGRNFSVPVALHVSKIVTQFLDFLVPDTVLIASVLEGSSCQYKALQIDN